MQKSCRDGILQPHMQRSGMWGLRIMRLTKSCKDDRL
ncbi:hypothetical protein Barb4_00825 [Bacteroidales bacterium Barb4]|nr:hypothetical protein Barb4_00825 [Bacteroidales bacterium Barb4]